MRRGAIVKALAELSRDSRGKGMRLLARFYEQYGEVKADDHDMQLPLADLVADNATSVFEQRPEAPRHHEPAASVTDQVAASREGLTIDQREYRASLVASEVLSSLSGSKQAHQLFVTWFACWVHERAAPAQATDVNWLHWMRLALDSGVCSSPLLRDAAARVKAGLDSARGAGISPGVTCVITGQSSLIVHASMEITGELAQASVHVLGLSFVAWLEGDETRLYSECGSRGATR